jgi:nucleotide-binding universal stress UspA family protein
MSKVLVAVNGSPTSEKALEAAVSLAQSHDARLVAVGVFDHPVGPHIPPLSDIQASQVRSHLNELLQSAANFARSRGLSLTPILREGHAAEAILACADEEKADLLVLGAGSGHSDGRGLGSTADQVSNHCPCAVLLVNQGGWFGLHGTETLR